MLDWVLAPSRTHSDCNSTPVFTKNNSLHVNFVSCTVFLFGEGGYLEWGMDVVGFELMLL